MSDEREWIWPVIQHGEMTLTTRRAVVMERGMTVAVQGEMRLRLRWGKNKGEPVCQEGVWSGHGSGDCQNRSKYYRPAPYDDGAPAGAMVGYCGTHDPERVAEKKATREAEERATATARRQHEARVVRVRAAEAAVIKAAVEWAPKEEGAALHSAVNELVRARGVRS